MVGKLGNGVVLNNNNVSRCVDSRSNVYNITTLATDFLNNQSLNRTMQVWAYPESVTGSLCVYYTADGSTRWYLCSDGATPNHWQIGLGSTSTNFGNTINRYSWELLTFVQKDNTASFYVNKTKGGNTSYANYSVISTVKIGGSVSGSDKYIGIVDESRIRTAMTAAEINATYDNMDSPSTFYTLGAIKSTVIDTVSPSYSGISAVPTSPYLDNRSSLPVRFNITLTDETDLASVTFNLGGTPFVTATSGTSYSFSQSYNLSCGNSTYFWNVSDSSDNTNQTANLQYEHDCDLLAPVISGIATAPSSPLSNYLVSYPVQFNASINDNILVSSVTFNLSGVLYNFTPAVASYAFSQVYNVSCGNTTYSWTATDGVGNGADSGLQVFTYNCDNEPPTYSGISTYPISPHNDNTTGSHPVLFNITVDDNFQLSRIIFDLNSVEHEFNITGTEYNFSQTLNISCGSTSYHWHISDARNNTNMTSQFSYQHDCDSEAPYVVIFEPVGNYANLTVPFDVYAINNVSMDVCWAQLDFSGYIPNPTCGNSTITTTNGAHIVYFYGNDSVGNVNFTYSNFFIDTIPPVITISSPPSTVLFNNNLPSYPILVVFTATDTGVNNVTCQYKLDAGAVGNTTCNQFTVNVTDFNTHSVTVYAIDSLGNNASAIVSFHVAIAGHAQVEGFTAIALRAIPFLFLGLLIFIGYMIMMAGQQENDMKRILSGFVVMLLGLIFFIAINSAVVIMTTAP